MAFLANALPRGLVDLLDLASQGRGPNELSEIIAGTLDLQDFFLLNKRERFVATGIAAGTSAGFWAAAALFTVPASQVWIPIAMTVQAVIPLGLTAAIAPAIQMPLTAGGGSQSFMVGEPQSNGSSALASNVAAHATKLVIAPPGSIFGGNTPWLSAATAFTASISLDFVRMRI